MVKIELKGREHPVELNGAAMEIITDLSGTDFTTFMERLGKTSMQGKLDVKSIITFLYAVLVGGALANDEDFKYSRQAVASWVTLQDLGDILNSLMALVPDGEEVDEKKVKGGGRKVKG